TTFTSTTDQWWKAVSRSGTSKIGKTVIVPTLNAPSSAKNGAKVTVSGVALPKQHVLVYVRAAGSTTWTKVADVVSGGSGRWVAIIRESNSPAVLVTSHGQTSRTLVIKTS